MNGLRRSGFSLTELLVAITVTGVLVALLVPAVQSARESARRTQCSARMNQIGRAIHAFETARGRIPKYDPRFDPEWRSGESSHVPLLPWLDQASLYEKLGPPYQIVGLNRGLVALGNTSQLISTKLPIFTCPSDSGKGLNSYYYNFGSLIAAQFDVDYDDAPKKYGPFAPNPNAIKKLTEIRDGLSNTAAVSERLFGSYDESGFDRRRDVWFSGLESVLAQRTPELIDTDWAMNLCRSANPVPGQFAIYVGETWAYGSYETAWYNHVAGPNSDVPACSTYYPQYSGVPGIMMSKRGIFAATSAHRGRVNVLLADGSVRGVSSQIDLQIWREFGTVNGGETTADF